MKTQLWLFVLTGSLCLIALPCSAHNLKVFASATGLDITGYVYFTDGTSVPNIPVSVQVADQVVAELNSDQQGEFHYYAEATADHLISVNAGEGHLAHYTVKAAELSGATVTPTPETTKPSTITTSPAVCDNTVEQNLHILQTQISSLQQQIAAYEAKIRWHDVLGGLGYIIGLAGFWVGWQRHRTQTTKGH